MAIVPIGLKELNATIANMQAMTEGFAKTQTDFSASEAAAYRNKADAQKGEGEADVVIAAEDATNKLRKQEQKQAFAKRMGIEQDSQELIALQSELVSSLDASKANAQELAALTSISPSDDILGWIGAQIQVPFKKQDQALLDQRSATLKAGLDARMELTQRNAATINAIDEGASAAKVGAAIQRAISQANIKVAETQIAAAQAGMASTNLIMATNLKQVELSRLAYDAEIKRQELQLAMNKDARDAARLKLEEEAATWKRQLQQDQLDEKSDFIKRVNTVRAANGEPAVTLSDVKNMSARQREVLMQQISDVNLTSGRIESSLAATRAYFLQMGNSGKIADGMKEALSAAAQIEQRFIANYNQEQGLKPGGKPFASLSKEEQRALVEDATDKALKGMRSSISPGDTGNIYNPPPLAVMVRNVPALAANPIINAMKGLAADGNYQLRPEDVMAAADSIGLKGEQRANAVARLYRDINQVTYETKQFQRLGVPPPKGYTTTAQLPGGMWGKDSMQVDWTSPASVLNFELRSQWNKTGALVGTDAPAVREAQTRERVKAARTVNPAGE